MTLQQLLSRIEVIDKQTGDELSFETLTVDTDDYSLGFVSTPGEFISIDKPTLQFNIKDL